MTSITPDAISNLVKEASEELGKLCPAIISGVGFSRDGQTGIVKLPDLDEIICYQAYVNTIKVYAQPDLVDEKWGLKSQINMQISNLTVSQTAKILEIIYGDK